MQRIQELLAAAVAFLSRWFWPVLALCGLVVAFSVFRACSVKSQVEAVFHGQPAVPAKVVVALEKKNAALEVKVEKATAQKDSAVQAAVVHEATADALQAQTDTLTASYDAIPATLSTATLPELQHDLSTYRPTPFPDTAR